MKPISWKFTLTALVLAATLVASKVAERRHSDFLKFPLSDIATDIAGWTVVGEQSLDPRALSVLVPTDYISRLYQKRTNQLALFIAYYADQRTGESIHSPRHCLPGSGWEIWRYGRVTVPVNDHSVKVNNCSIQRAGARAIVLYWYQSKQRILASEYLGKMMLIRDALLDGRTAGALVRITIPDEVGAVESGTEFAARLIPQVQRCFGE